MGITADSMNFYSDDIKIFTNLKNIIIEYGKLNNKKDITNICLNKYCVDNIITIPTNDVIRAQMFGDPVQGQIKSVYINNEEYQHDEEINYNINVPLKKYYNAKTQKIKDNLTINYLNYIQKIKWSPNKQFGIFKENWDKFKFFRNNNYGSYNIYREHAPDTATGFFVRDNNYYFIYSYIPRCNDIGLFNQYGWTQLHYDKNQNIPISTIKYLTSNNFIYKDLILNLEFYNGENYKI